MGGPGREAPRGKMKGQEVPAMQGIGLFLQYFDQ